MDYNLHICTVKDMQILLTFLEKSKVTSEKARQRLERFSPELSNGILSTDKVEKVFKELKEARSFGEDYSVKTSQFGSYEELYNAAYDYWERYL